MGYHSFYGGRRGASFILSGKFNSYQEMINNFKLGNEYSTINFDEYVIIESTDADNGEIYRRGYDYNNEKGGAIYVGRISGPIGLPGMAPLVSLDTYENVMARPEEKTEGAYTLNNNDLVPGKYVENGEVKYNDTINWVGCSFVTHDHTESYAYIGFTFPYTVLDFEAEQVSPYYTGSLIERIDDNSHPFYQQMKLLLPQGKQGDSIKNIRIGLASEITEDYAGKQDDITNNRYVFMCDYYDYTNQLDGEKSVIYLGDYNIIKNIILNTDGTLTFSYTHNDNTVYDKRLKWIISTVLDVGAIEGDGTQKIKITYNTGEEVTLGNAINYIIKTAVTDNYHLLFLYSDPARRAEIVAAGKNATWDGRSDWEDLGSIKNYNGILVGLNLKVADISELGTQSGVINYLNITYPSGLTGLDLQGKIVSVTDLFNEVTLYAFDYDKQSWFSLGQISGGSGGGGTVVGPENDAAIQELVNDLPFQGVWFITE